MNVNLNFMEAESIALNLAYKQFFGEGQPVGVAFTFIADRREGKEWTQAEKDFAKYVSRVAIGELKRINLTALIESGAVPDCAMSRRFMATGSGQTSTGHNY